MARVRWHGTEFSAKELETLPDGRVRMEAIEHTARTRPGTVIIVKANEIISREDAPAVSVNATNLEAAMAEERKTLPTPQELIMLARDGGTLPRPKPPEPDAL